MNENTLAEWLEKYLVEPRDVFTGRVVPEAAGLLDKLIAEIEARTWEEAKRIAESSMVDLYIIPKNFLHQRVHVKWATRRNFGANWCLAKLEGETAGFQRVHTLGSRLPTSCKDRGVPRSA